MCQSIPQTTSALVMKPSHLVSGANHCHIVAFPSLFLVIFLADEGPDKESY